MSYQDDNMKTIESWIADGWKWGIPLSHEAFLDAKSGKFDIYLTPCKPIPKSWIGDVSGKKILGLASGGGQQMPVLTALGASCTMLDYSQKQCESELMVARREGYDIEVVRADMTKPLPFADESFDMIVHPVSNCYIEEPIPVFKECYRILKKGGVLLSGLDNGMNYVFDSDEKVIINKLPFNPLKNPEHKRQLEDADCGMQFSHTADEQLGGQTDAGFAITGIFEDYNDEGNLAAMGIASYWCTKAVKL